MRRKTARRSPKLFSRRSAASGRAPLIGLWTVAVALVGVLLVVILQPPEPPDLPTETEPLAVVSELRRGAVLPSHDAKSDGGSGSGTTGTGGTSGTLPAGTGGAGVSGGTSGTGGTGGAGGLAGSGTGSTGTVSLDDGKHKVTADDIECAEGDEDCLFFKAAYGYCGGDLACTSSILDASRGDPDGQGKYWRERFGLSGRASGGDEARRARLRRGLPEESAARKPAPAYFPALASEGVPAALRAFAPVAELAAAFSQFAAPAAWLAALVSTLATGASVVAFAGGIAGAIQSLFPFLGTHRRRRSIGRVVEDGTSLPLADVLVTILDAQGKPREVTRSTVEGTFATLLPKGTYRLAVKLAGYVLSSAPHVALFPGERLYTGGDVEVSAGETVVPFVLALGPTTTRKHHPALFRSTARSLLARLKAFQARAAVYILLVGTVLNSFALLARPTKLLITFQVLYGLLLLFELFVGRKFLRALGHVLDAATSAPVALAIVRLVEQVAKRLVATRVSSPNGTFLLMPPPGTYALQVIHPSYRPYVDAAFRVKPGTLGPSKVTVKLTRRPGVPAPGAPPPPALGAGA